MKIKVCGMNNKQDITNVVSAGANLIGLIFYDKSPRSADKGDVDADFVKQLAVSIVGVFVNENINTVTKIAQDYDLDYLQLHGDESPEYCSELKNKGYKVWKAFSVAETLDKEKLKNYEDVVDYYLFDTKGINYGGNGRKFNWDVLDEYNLSKPFFLSGGLSLSDAQEVSNFVHERFWGVDLNSGFEQSPGQKKANEIEEFINNM
ncbi:MAG: phosphoribosylanthranilate isomerase [Cyclobacteriaceae bacterium]|nr:phosphoribosylanthranilate isomerase [Cyclobacteriaceae bacterium]